MNSIVRAKTSDRLYHQLQEAYSQGDVSPDSQLWDVAIKLLGNLANRIDHLDKQVAELQLQVKESNEVHARHAAWHQQQGERAH